MAPFFENDEEHCNLQKANDWRPPSGSSIIRVLPTWKPKDAPKPRLFWREFREHFFKVGEQTFVFPSSRNFDQEDPIWDTGELLVRSKDEDLVELGKTLIPKRKFYFNVVVLQSAPSEFPVEVGAVTVMKVGPKVAEPIIKQNRNKATKFHTITDPYDGVNLQVERTGSGLTNTQYSVNVVGERTNIMEDISALGITVDEETLAASIRDLDEFVESKLKTEDEVLNILSKVFRGNGLSKEYLPMGVTLPFMGTNSSSNDDDAMSFHEHVREAEGPPSDFLIKNEASDEGLEPPKLK